MTDGKTYGFGPLAPVENLQQGLPQQADLQQIAQSYLAQQCQTYQEMAQAYGLGAPQGLHRHASDPAEKKAHALLLRLLRPDQRKEYEQTRMFSEVRDNKRYLLNYDTMGVCVYSGFALEETWCVYCPNCPRTDTLIAQLLLIRDDPEKLKAKAHVTKYADCMPVSVIDRGRRGGVRQLMQRVWGDNTERRERIERIMRRAGY